MPTTSPSNLRYPASTDTPNVPRDMGYLAADVETALATKATTAHQHSGTDLTVVDAAGDLLVGSADNTVGRLPLGTNGYVLTVDTSGSGVNKVKWAAASGGGTIGLDSVFLLMGA